MQIDNAKINYNYDRQTYFHMCENVYFPLEDIYEIYAKYILTIFRPS